MQPKIWLLHLVVWIFADNFVTRCFYLRAGKVHNEDHSDGTKRRTYHILFYGLLLGCGFDHCEPFFISHQGQIVQTRPGAHEASFLINIGRCFSGLKRPESETDHSPNLISRLRMSGAITCIHFPIRLHGVYRDRFSYIGMLNRNLKIDAFEVAVFWRLLIFVVCNEIQQ
jgi:hypothetical protein